MARLTDEEYEDAYAETLGCLVSAGRKVGVPYTEGVGIRYCTVDDKALDDRGVISALWSEGIARKILYGR